MGLHREGVVQVGLQVGHDDGGLRQVGGSRLESHFLVAVFAGHAVGEVVALARHQRGAPGQLQPALGRQRHRAQVAGGAGRSLRRKRTTEKGSARFNKRKKNSAKLQVDLSGTGTRAGRRRGVRGGAEEAVLALALGGAGCRGLGVAGANLAELGRLGRLEVTRLASCARQKEDFIFYREEGAAVKRDKGRKE